MIDYVVKPQNYIIRPQSQITVQPYFTLTIISNLFRSISVVSLTCLIYLRIVLLRGKHFYYCLNYYSEKQDQRPALAHERG